MYSSITLSEVNSATKKVDVLLLEDDRDYAHSLKLAIESRLPVQVTIMRTVEIARKLLTVNASQYFIGITSVLNLNSAEFEKVDLLGEFDSCDCHCESIRRRNARPVNQASYH